MRMRFMMIVKSAEKWGFPPKELMEAIGRLSEEAVQSGAMVGSGGLRPTAQGACVRLKGGQVTVIDGPFTEAKEVVGGVGQLYVKSKEESNEMGKRFMGHDKQTLAGLGG